MVLVTYDVCTSAQGGAKRLNRVAKTCLDFGLRVQNSVFECKVDPGQFAELKKKLTEIIAPEADSLRFYMLGSKYKHRIEHIGAKPTVDIDGALII